MMSRKMVAVIGVLVIVALVVGSIIWSQALATTTLSAAAEQECLGSAMHEDCPGESHDTHHSDTHEDCPGENHDADHRDTHGGSDAHHSGMHRH